MTRTATAAPTITPAIAAVESPLGEDGMEGVADVNGASASVTVLEFEQRLIISFRTTGLRLLAVVGFAFHIVKVFSS